MNYVLLYCHGPYETVIVVEKNKPDWQRGKYNLPGGKIEEGETPEQAAKRELLEETGCIAAAPIRLMGELRDGDSIIYCFRVITLQVQPPEDAAALKWVNWYALKDDPKLIPNLRVIIPLMMTGVDNWIVIDDEGGVGKVRHQFSINVPGDTPLNS